MANIANRSRFLVTVKNRDDLTKHFPFDKLHAVKTYMEVLRAQHLKPKVVQLDESWLVRIREKGHDPMQETFGCEADATQFVEKVTEERRRGLFTDYTAARKVSFADLIVRYLLEEIGRHKSAQVLAYTLEGWLEDSGQRGQELLAGYREKLREQGRPVREPKFKMRQASEDLAWIHKSLPAGRAMLPQPTQQCYPRESTCTAPDIATAASKAPSNVIAFPSRKRA